MEECLKHNRNRYEKNAYKRYVHKLNKIYLWINSFEQQCILPYSFLNQGKNSAHCSLIVLKYDDFNLQCISNDFFLKQYNKKIIIKYVLIEKFIRMHFLFCLLQLHLPLPRISIQENTYLIHHKSYGSVLPKHYGHNLVFISENS